MSGNFSKPTVETNNLSEHFRRTDPRYDRRLDVEIVVGNSRETLITRNFSLGGMLVETRNPLPLLTPVLVRFRVPTHSDIIEITGEVRWIEPGASASGMGIRFHGLRAREVWALNRFFQS